ncbi:MAG: type II secretion system minor pseudopilin GspJ [Endozoicomonadaceae bacterium]|nr:type II secretion system minor pseudopilin GspJ [Endozoicomonadaceae bacterium]
MEIFNDRFASDNIVADNTARGFTLLELMIAIAIFAILATACYQLLTTSTEAQKTTNGVWSKLNTIQKAHLIIEKDLMHMIARPVRDSANNQQPAMSGGANKPNKQILMTFTRSGHYNLTREVRSDLIRVMYTVESEKLIRSIWFTLDSVTDQPPVRQVLMEGVTGANMHFLDQKKKWTKSWPPASEKRQTGMVLLPKGIYLRLSHQQYGELKWWFRGVDAPPEKINTIVAQANNHQDQKRYGMMKGYENQGNDNVQRRYGLMRGYGN